MRSDKYIGIIFKLFLCTDRFVQVVPVQKAISGFFKGCYLCYIFDQSIDISSEKGFIKFSDLLIPPKIIIPQTFKDGTLENTKNKSILSSPLPGIHAFENNIMKSICDIDGNRIEGEYAIIAREVFTNALGICFDVSKVYDLDVDCRELLNMPAERIIINKSKLKNVPNKHPITFILIVRAGSNSSIISQNTKHLEREIKAFLHAEELGELEKVKEKNNSAEFSITAPPGKLYAALSLVISKMNSMEIFDFDIVRE